MTVQLGAVGFESKDPAVWSNLLVDLLGLVPAGPGADGAGRYRMDGHAWRFEVQQGPADDLAWLAWEMDDDELDAAVARARADGVAVAEADPAERDAERRFVLVDPAGIPTELVTGLRRAETPFASPVVPAGFVADELGWGHIVLSTRDKAESVAFYQRLLGIKLSDHIVCTYYGHAVDLSFFHTNARHHSVAFGGPQRKRLNHFMIQAQEMNDVGLAFDRCLQAGVRIHQTPGRHPNDQMYSFYARAPGGFQFEFGWGARLVDDTTWAPVTWDRISDWGHHPPATLAGGSPR